jgi:hypothetical protein
MAGWGGMGGSGGDAQRAQSRGPGPPRRSGGAPVRGPDEGSWRYRTTGGPKLLAVFGIVIGFLAGFVPGIIAMGSYRRWRIGARSQPKFAWFMAVAGLCASSCFLLYRFTPIGAIAVPLALISIPVVALVFLTL